MSTSRTKKRFVSLLAAGIGLSTAVSAAQGSENTFLTADPEGKGVEKDGRFWGRLLASEKGGRGVQGEALAKSHGARVTRCTRLPLLVLALPDAGTGRATAARLRASGLFDYIEPDVEVHATATSPNDPRYAELWAMPKISAPAAWDLQTSANSLVVAVVDTGIWAQHPDLAGNVWVNPATGTAGYKYINGVESTNPDDDHGHGTHVAGTIGAVGNNGLGVAGVNWSAKIAAFKFLDSAGSGYISDAVLCYDKILQLKQQGVNIRVVNNSWGGGGYSQAFADALQAVTDAGILSVFAAGNNAANTDLQANYPSCYTNLLVAVLASDSSDNRAGFSNYGYATADIAAPGVGILSTVPTNGSLSNATGYNVLSGTSMATPHVVGALAALFQRYPSLTPQQAWSVLLDPGSCDALGTSAASTSCGGRINLYKLLTNPYVNNPVPNRPPAVTGSIQPPYAFRGEAVQIGFSGADPDGDPLRFAGFRNGLWLANRLLRNIPADLSGPASFAVPLLARPVWLNYVMQANDRRGGTAGTQQGVTLVNDPSATMTPPTGRVTATLVDAATLTYRIDFPMTDPDSAETWFHLTIGNSSFCCYQGSLNVRFTGWTGSQARIAVLGMDSELNEARDATEINFGTVSNGLAPHAVVRFDRAWGEVPLALHFDATASTDADSAKLTAQVVFIDTCGSLTPEASPQVALDPGGLSGTLTFDRLGSWFVWVLIRDEKGNCDSVAQYVYALPPAGPVANPQTVTTAEDTACAVTLTGSTPAGDPLTYQVVAGPSHGTLKGSAPELTYTPAANYNGSDSFTFKVGDGVSDSEPATVSISVTPVNDPPVALSQSLGTREDVAVSLTLTGQDVDGDPLTYRVVSGPSHGALRGTAPNLTYAPATNYNGSDTFNFTVSDGQVDSSVAAVGFSVVAVNDPPSFALKATSLNVRRNEGPQTMSGWATGISPGPADEAGQTVRFEVSNNSPSLFSVQPAISTTGVLTFTPSAGKARGTATVTVVARDNGGTANGGSDGSAPRSFTIKVQ